MAIKNKYSLKNIITNAVLSFAAILVLVVSIFSGVIAVGQISRPLDRGESEHNVALMFNISWGSEHIEPLLSALRREGVTATFFIGGLWAFNNEDLLLNIYADGHEIGNLGYFQIDHRQVNQARSREDIQANHRLINNILNFEMTLFSPPMGFYSDATIKAANGLGYRVIIPTIETFDWRDRNRNLIHDRATENLGGGNFVSLHPTHHTIEALPNIISTIRSQRFNVTTVSQAILQTT
ncbi:MAG: polysaccharide deacetylase family protein [Firmicutes bacterium]|nr:polysaccharide deacetylase family protein [Bacillota bacterium]